MHTKILILGLSIATIPSIAVANDIIDFLEKWRGFQQGYNQRYDRWDDYRQERPGPYQEEGRRPVPPQRQPIPQNDRDPVRYEADLLVNKMQPYVTAISDSVAPVDDRDLIRSAERAESSLRKLEAAIDRSDTRDLIAHHEDFDKNWQTTVYTLQNKYKSGPKLQSYISTVNEYDLRLHQLLNVGHRPGFERHRVIQLTKQLDESVEDLEKELSGQVENWQHQMLAYQARRVGRHADDLADLARTQATHDALSEEFQQFDAAWHTLEERIRAFGRSGLNVQREISQVRSIDRELHDVILVEAPIVSDSRSFEAVLHRAEETADEIGDEIRRTSDYSNRFGQRRLAGNLFRLEEALEDLADRPESQRTKEQWQLVASHWTSIKAIYNEAPDRYSARTQEMLQQLKRDIEFLSRRFSEERNWRYSRR